MWLVVSVFPTAYSTVQQVQFFAFVEAKIPRKELDFTGNPKLQSLVKESPEAFCIQFTENEAEQYETRLT